jgi:hypothetical protein
MSLEIPKLYVYGSENAHLAHIPVLKSAGVMVREISDSNHFPAYSNPEFYYEVLAEFMRGSY